MFKITKLNSHRTVYQTDHLLIDNALTKKRRLINIQSFPIIELGLINYNLWIGNFSMSSIYAWSTDLMTIFRKKKKLSHFEFHRTLNIWTQKMATTTIVRQPAKIVRISIFHIKKKQHPKPSFEWTEKEN